MMQGDSYKLKVAILSPDQTALTPADLVDVEITIGSLVKSYSAREVTFEDDAWWVHLTQEDTFKMPASRIKAQVRVKWPDGNVEGQALGQIINHESMSKGVL